MDVDEVQVEFEVTPAPDEYGLQALARQFFPFPFTYDARSAILARRSVMSEELVFDLLLEQASIASPQSLYPPNSPESLLNLLEAIANCPWDVLKKSCIQFYLLCHVSTSVASRHATACALPPQFVHLAHACFLLDSGSLEDLSHAVTLLSDARIVQDLSPKILYTLSLAPQPTSSLLVRTYVRTAQPVLEEYEDLAIYLRALIEYSLADAWSFQRTFSEITPIRNQLIRTILDACLIREGQYLHVTDVFPDGVYSISAPKPVVLPLLLSLPLTSYEFSLLQSYALAPPEDLSAAAHAILQNLITVRLLHSGKYIDAVRISHAFDALNAKSRFTAASPLRKASEERQQMMRDILAVIPDVQRRQLELELSDGYGGLSASSLSASWTNVGNDISMSWENLGTSASRKAYEKIVDEIRSCRLEGSPAPAIPGRSNIPFGPFTPTSSVLKRKVSSNLKDLGKVPAPMFPQIPVSSLAIATSVDTSLPFGLRQPSRLGFPPPSHPGKESQTSSLPGPMRAGLNTRNAFYEPEPSHVVPSLFVHHQQGIVVSPFPSPARRNVDDENITPGIHAKKNFTGAEQTLAGQDATSKEAEDIVMLDSDDPDVFVVRGRGKPPKYHSKQNGSPNADRDPNHTGVNGAAALFTRDISGTRMTDDARRTSDDRVLPGGFSSIELIGDNQQTLSSNRTTQEAVSLSQTELKSSQTQVLTVASETQPSPPPASSPRLKIPGALDDDDDVEAQEENDNVSSLPPLPTPARVGQRKRTNRAASVVTDPEEDNRPHTPLRRSSRLSSTGPSPELLEKRTATKRSAKASGNSKTGRKRKNMDG